MSDEKQTVERIWVGVRQGAEITGRRKEYLRGLAFSIWQQPPEERPLKVRFRSNRYEFWLPDLIPYLENSGGDSVQEPSDVEPIWVNVTEAATITGYNRGHISRLVRSISNQPEEEQTIKVRRRTNGFELWLPDLIYYVETIGNGPEPKRSLKTQT